MVEHGVLTMAQRQGTERRRKHLILQGRTKKKVPDPHPPFCILGRLSGGAICLLYRT